MKGWVAARSLTYKLTDIEKLFREKVSTMGKEEWSPFCQRVKHLEEKFRETDILFTKRLVELLLIWDAWTVMT